MKMLQTKFPTSVVTLVVLTVGLSLLATTHRVEGQAPGGAAPYRLGLYVGGAENRKIWIVNASTLKVLETVEHERIRNIHHLAANPNGDIFTVSLMGGIQRFSRAR